MDSKCYVSESDIALSYRRRLTVIFTIGVTQCGDWNQLSLNEGDHVTFCDNVATALGT